MSHARIVVELLPGDSSAKKLIESLKRAFDFACPEISCSVEQKREFSVARNFENGTELAVQEAIEVDEPWCIYLSPRRIRVVLNHEDLSPLCAVLVAIARHKKPVALFLHTITTVGVPQEYAVALSQKVDASRQSLVTDSLNDLDEAMIGRFCESIGNAYTGAFTKSRMN